MNQTETLFFFTTAGCHLCEIAQVVCESTLNPDFFIVHMVDIADDDALIEQYGLRIPVLKRQLNGEELNWPFDQQKLIEFLSTT